MGGRKYTYITTFTERETSSYPKRETGQGFGMKKIFAATAPRSEIVFFSSCITFLYYYEEIAPA
jgi:hypothetical protein